MPIQQISTQSHKNIINVNHTFKDFRKMSLLVKHNKQRKKKKISKDTENQIAVFLGIILHYKNNNKNIHCTHDLYKIDSHIASVHGHKLKNPLVHTMMEIKSRRKRKKKISVESRM